MQHIVLNRPQNEGVHAPLPHHRYGAATFRVVAEVASMIVTAVAQFFQMIGFCFAAAWLQNRSIDCHVRLVLAFIPANERVETRVLVLRTITPQMGVFERKIILETVLDISHEEREEVVTNALLLIKPEDGPFERTFVIEKMVGVPVNERGPVTAFVLDAITGDMNLPQRLWIFQAVADISARERANVMEHVFQIITDQMEYFEIVTVIERMALAAAHARPNLLQRFRNGQDIFLHGAGDIFLEAPFAIARGTNVHQGDRDQRVRAAIELVRKHQGPISGDRMNQAVWGFTQYLNGRKMNPEHKKLAQHALRGPFNPADFGPLIDGNEFMIKGLKISGKEVIGRLWIFASNLTGLDQAIAKEGMISALKESYDMGGRVCQPGKVQRLIVSVLQGRLAKVNIELVEGMKVDKPVALCMFFHKAAHMAIRQLPPLIDAANQFCDDNPLVDRDEFLRGIEEYAEAEFD